MKNKIVASFAVILLVLTLVQITLNFAPAVFSDPGVARREFWQVVSVTNTLPYSTLMDLNVTASSRRGINIACSNNVTRYFQNVSGWQTYGYFTYWDWLNGTVSSVYHWGEMDWFVSNGSLTPISYNDIQHWGDMYFDSGGGVNYTTFMGNTYMADWNLTDPNNDPDIVYQAYWQGNQIKMIDDMLVPNMTTINIVFKIVMTETGGYTFNITTTPGVTVSPSSWTVGGYSTILVPFDYTTIQAAINAANPNDTIVVYGGTYTEDLVVPTAKTNLDIKSYAGASVTIKGIKTSLATEFPLVRPNIEINAKGVRIHGFTIAGPDYVANYYSSGIVIGAANVEIYDNDFKVTPAASSGEISQAMQTYRYNSVPGVDISGLSIHNNTFTDLNAGAAGYEGIYINLDAGNNSASIWNNTFSGNIVRAITTERSNFTISSNNIITDLAPGDPGSGGWQGINVMGANGVLPGDTHNVTNVSVIGNTIKGSASGKGFRYGLKLGYEDASTMMAISVTNNTIQTSETGIWVRYSASGVRVKWNNFANNTNYGVLNDNTTQTLNAAYNWWGNETGPHHSALNPNGLGDNVSDYVIFEPWLTKPNPPLVPVSVVYVDAPFVAFQTPSLGAYFVANVTIANVTMLYGFQITVKWNSTLLNLTQVFKRIPVTWGSNYFISQESARIGNYTLAVAARLPASPFNGTATVLSLTFISNYDPPYPNNATCLLELLNVTLGDPGAQPILRLTYNGNYTCYSARPKVLFMSNEYTAKKVPTYFDAYVNVTNVVNLYAINFTFTFNSTLLTAQNITVQIPCQSYFVGFLSDTVFVNITGIVPPVNGTRILAKVTFKVARGFIWNTETPTVNCTLNFTLHNLATQDGTQIEHEAINGTYVYRPIPGDVNAVGGGDGLVDVVDLVRLAQEFGTAPGGPPYSDFDLNHDGVIDILDIILVAHNFGRTEP